MDVPLLPASIGIAMQLALVAASAMADFEFSGHPFVPTFKIGPSPPHLAAADQRTYLRISAFLI